MSRRYTLAEIAQRVGGALRDAAGAHPASSTSTVGGGPRPVDPTSQDASAAILTGAADLLEAGPTEVAWVTSPKYAKRIGETRAAAVLVPADFELAPVPSIACARIDRAVAVLLAMFADDAPAPTAGVHTSAIVDPAATLGTGVSVGPFVQIEAEARIGDGTVLHAGVFIGRRTTLGRDCVVWPNVVIRDCCRIGDRVVLHPNVVIGADGFGYYLDQGRHCKVPHIGGVILEDDVEIGACACVDRAKFGFTRIGKGTKIDNLCQIGHNVRIGEHCVLAGQTGIAGSVRIGDGCVLGGRAGVVDNVSLGPGSRVSVASIVYGDVAPGTTVSGYPANEHQRYLREQALVRRLPEIATELRELRARVRQLEAAADDPSRRGD